MMDQRCVMSGAVQGQQRTIGGEAVGGRQVVERLHRQLCLFLPLTRLRLAFRRHTSDAMLKKCRRREGGEKGRRRNSYETKGSLKRCSSVEKRLNQESSCNIGFQSNN